MPTCASSKMGSLFVNLWYTYPHRSITFKSMYNYYNFIIIVNTVSWLHTTYKNLKRDEEAKIFFVGNILCILFVISDVYITMSGHIFNLSTPFIYAFIFSMIAIILFLSENLHREKQLYSVNIEQKRSYKASITDGMTGLYNHAYMMNTLNKAVPPYSVAMLDIDDFKEINDSFRHRSGDTVICHVALNLKKKVRSNDLVFRYGGDEFFVILFGCTAEKAKEIMLKIKQCIEIDCPKHNEKPIAITLSGGIYYVEKEEEPESIFDKVDSALYYSKNNGKNSINIYSEIYNEIIRE